MPTTRKPHTSIVFTGPDRELIARVKARYGTNTLRDTILHALRLADTTPRRPPTPRGR